MKNILNSDTAFLSFGDKTIELDLITLKLKEHKRKYNDPIVFKSLKDKKEIKKTQLEVYEKINNERICEFKDRSIKGLTVIPSWYCSAKCSYCYAASHKKDETTLTEQKVEEFIKKFNINVNNIKGGMFLGGDPLEKLDIVKYVINRFPKTDWTICTAFPVDDDIIEDLLSFIMFKKNVEISLSIDLDNSLRYKASTEKNRKDKNIYWFNRFYNYIGNRIRIKATLNRDAVKIDELRKSIPKTARINFDGVGYGFEDIRLSDNKSLEDIKNLYDNELHKFINGEVTLNNTFFANLFPMTNRESLITTARTCGCGFSYYTLLPDGNLSYCDSPGKPLLNENLYSEELVKDAIKTTGVCKECNYLKLCGGSCGINNFKELYCYVKVIDYVYSLYLALFITRENV